IDVVDYFESELYSFADNVTRGIVFLHDDIADQAIDENTMDLFCALGSEIVTSYSVAQRKELLPLQEIDLCELLFMWIKLGMVVEYALAAYLFVYREFTTDRIRCIPDIRSRKIEKLTFNELILFYQQVVLNDGDEYYLNVIKDNRNAVHLIKNTQSSSWTEFKKAIECCFSLLNDLNNRFPEFTV
ncbi:MAG: hypothetical protein IJC70_01300, partial [Firmicutes bacterium]|nr:hypothetical protein [Bacillota bacterium]